jgi:L-alanine-DL-glutamate epimerase-like enolase superfamily enzyme
MMEKTFKVDNDGWIRLGDAPGLGYALDEKMLEKTRIG